MPQAFPILPVYATLAVSTRPICGPPGSIRDHACNQLGPCIGYIKSDAASLRMSNQDDRSSDLIEESDACGHRQFCLRLSGANCTCLDKVIEDRVAHVPFFGESLGHCV